MMRSARFEANIVVGIRIAHIMTTISIFDRTIFFPHVVWLELESIWYSFSLEVSGNWILFFNCSKFFSDKIFSVLPFPLYLIYESQEQNVSFLWTESKKSARFQTLFTDMYIFT
jgi:hypothetical protein